MSAGNRMAWAIAKNRRAKTIGLANAALRRLEIEGKQGYLHPCPEWHELIDFSKLPRRLKSGHPADYWLWNHREPEEYDHSAAIEELELKCREFISALSFA